MGSSPTQSPKPKCVGQVTHTTLLPMDIRLFAPQLTEWLQQAGVVYDERAQRLTVPTQPMADNVGRMRMIIPQPRVFDEFLPLLDKTGTFIQSILNNGSSVYDMNVDTHPSIYRDRAFRAEIGRRLLQAQDDLGVLLASPQLNRIHIGCEHPNRLAQLSAYARGDLDRPTSLCYATLAYRELNETLFSLFDVPTGSNNTYSAFTIQLFEIMGELVGSLNLLNERIDELADNLGGAPATEGDASTWAYFAFAKLCNIYETLTGTRQHMVLNEYVGHFKRVSVPMLKLKLNNMSDKIVDYAGDEWNADDVVVLTEPSEYEGEFAHVDDARTFRAYTNGYIEHLVTILETEFDDHFVEVVNGDIVAQDSNEIVYIDQGSEMGNYAWRDDTVYVEDVGDYYHTSDEGHYVFWDERNEEDVSEVPSNRNHGYHQGFRRDFTDPSTTYTIGFEVEKEDDCVMSDYDLDDADATEWCREDDGSLCDDSGFELVSPVYDLLSDRLDQDLYDKRTGDTLRAHINAEYSQSCGGHINLGERGKSGSDFFDSITAWIPLFLTIWRHRLGNTYSPIQRKPENYKRAGHYSAIQVRTRYIEIRLPSAVKNVNNLLWRRDLMRLVCTYQNLKPLQLITAMLSPKSDIGQHLRKVYSDADMLKVVSIYSQFADDMYGSYEMTNDGAGVFFKSTIRRLKNRKVTDIQIAQYADEAIDRLRRTFGHEYTRDAQGTLQLRDELINL